MTVSNKRSLRRRVPSLSALLPALLMVSMAGAVGSGVSSSAARDVVIVVTGSTTAAPVGAGTAEPGQLSR